VLSGSTAASTQEYAMASPGHDAVADSPATARAPLYIVLNSGSGKDDADEAARQIAAILTAANRAHDIIRLGDSMSMEQATSNAVAAARRTGGILVGAGGDGTLNAVAQAALASGCPFGVIPQGTFNYFARTHGIPQDTREAVRALLTARICEVPVGRVNEQLFLVNASVGLYPETLEAREQQKQRHGRRRSVAVWAALLTVLREHRPLRLRVELQSKVHEVSTLTFFVGLNRLQLEQAGLDTDKPSPWQLTAVVLKPVSTARLLWLMVKGAMGDLAQEQGVETFTFSRLAVAPANARVRQMKVATDGETRWMTAPLEFRIAAEPLRLLVPVNPDGAGEVRM
jgi:diacylglycerol kinase family enzyme